VSTVNRVKTV